LEYVSAFSDESWGGDRRLIATSIELIAVSAFSDESWGGDRTAFGHASRSTIVSAFSDESWGGDPVTAMRGRPSRLFQHSLMNLGVETHDFQYWRHGQRHVSAFSDESWGGDPHWATLPVLDKAVSAFSDESWGGDRSLYPPGHHVLRCFSIL